MPKKDERKNKRVKPGLPGGFRDYAPQDAILKARLLEKIKKTFEDFGFDPMETPAVERTEVLLGGEQESDKIIYRVNPASRGIKQGIKKDELSLRFDLTVPLARFLAANPEIPKPFKRYQLGNVWRGESPQAGRYREFMQADLDIVGSSSLEADAEIISVVYQVFKNIGLNKFLIRINNRKVLNGLPSYAGFPGKKLGELLRVIDKKDKIGPEAVLKDINKLLGKAPAAKVNEFLEISGDTKTKLINARALFVKIATAQEGIEELIGIARNLNAMGVKQENWEIDYSIVRGLGYYTGPIFEAVLTSARDFGSMASGGRYDNLLLPFTGEKLPAVGASFGIDRFLAALEKLGGIKKRLTTTKVLILNLSPELKPEYLEMASLLRSSNINTTLYLGDDRAFQAQLAYAVKKEIPYVIIYGEEERKKGVVTIKDMEKREQREIPKGNILQYFRK